MSHDIVATPRDCCVRPQWTSIMAMVGDLVTTRMLRLLAASAFALLALPVGAQPTVYRCESNGEVAYSDAPCVGAKVIDATPTQGMDKMTGQTRKGKEVQREEFHQQSTEPFDHFMAARMPTWT